MGRQRSQIRIALSHITIGRVQKKSELCRKICLGSTSWIINTCKQVQSQTTLSQRPEVWKDSQDTKEYLLWRRAVTFYIASLICLLAGRDLINRSIWFPVLTCKPKEVHSYAFLAQPFGWKSSKMWSNLKIHSNYSPFKCSYLRRRHWVYTHGLL